MQSREYVVDSVLAAVKLKPAFQYGRYRLSAIPAGATIAIQSESSSLSGMVDAVWNGEAYSVFPAELSEKTHPLAA